MFFIYEGASSCSSSNHLRLLETNNLLVYDPNPDTRLQVPGPCWKRHSEQRMYSHVGSWSYFPPFKPHLPPKEDMGDPTGSGGSFFSALLLMRLGEVFSSWYASIAAERAGRPDTGKGVFSWQFQKRQRRNQEQHKKNCVNFKFFLL